MSDLDLPDLLEDIRRGAADDGSRIATRSVLLRAANRLRESTDILRSFADWNTRDWTIYGEARQAAKVFLGEETKPVDYSLTPAEIHDQTGEELRLRAEIRTMTARVDALVAERDRLRETLVSANTFLSTLRESLEGFRSHHVTIYDIDGDEIEDEVHTCDDVRNDSRILLDRLEPVLLTVGENLRKETS
jgi:hypothetical protein